jgi:hypothetical protein
VLPSIQKGELQMLRTVILIAVGAFTFGLGSNALSIAQSSSNFEKKNFNYNEWTKGKFSEVVTVTNPGKFIFLAGIGPEREGDGKIVHEGNFMEQWQVRLHENQEAARYAGSHDERRCTHHDVHYRRSLFSGRTKMPCRGFWQRSDSGFNLPSRQPVGVAQHGH